MRSTSVVTLTVLALVAAAATPASAGLVTPHVYHSVLDMYPLGCGYIASVTTRQDYLYCAADSSHANYCIDISDPYNLQVTDEYVEDPGHSSEVVVWNGKLYAANWFTYLDVYDIASSPGTLIHLGNYTAPGLASFGIDVAHDRAYIGESNWPAGGFRIVDVSDPADMHTVSTCLPEHAVGSIAVRGSYAYVADDRALVVINVSDENNPYVVSSTDLGTGLQCIRIRGSYVYVTSVMPDGGLWIFNVSDPTNPVLESHILGPIGSISLVGSYLFAAGGSNKLQTVSISDPSNPYVVCVTNAIDYSDAANGWESAVCGQGNYIYVATNELYWINGNNEYKGKIYCFQAFDQDPDSIGPNNWSNFTPTEASWDTQYEGDALPSVSSPAWAVYSGSEASASVSDGVLRVNDTGSGDVVWTRNWNATNCRGATVLCRARCASYSPNGQSLITTGNIYLEDGKYGERFAILPTRIRASRAQIEYALDGTQWHTYRITTQGTQFRVYVDEGASPVLTGNLATASGRSRVMFGGTSGPAIQDIYFDFLHCFSNGAYGPSETITDATPDISAMVADSREPGSVSGISPVTARAYWSTDGGASWESSGGVLWDCMYEGDALPSTSAPAWALADGSESYGSVSEGVLRVYDNSTISGSKVKWARAWNASPSRGETVIARIRCAAIGGDQSLGGNIYIEDGLYKEFFRISTDRIEATQLPKSSATYDATQWHTYRITAQYHSYNVYLDENPTPILSGSMVISTANNRVMFGSGASAGTQDIYFDYVRYTADGVLLPGQGDGGGLVTVVCDGSPGDEQARITAYSVPFNQCSETLNKVKFSVKDVNGNTGCSPIYNVRILPGPEPPGPVTNFTATGGDTQVNLSWHTPPDAGFCGTMIRYKTTGYPYGTNDGTLLVNKPGTPNSDDSCTHTCLDNNGTTYYYSAFAYDSAPNYSPKADAAASPTGFYCFQDTFDYPNGYLNDSGCWSGTAGSAIQVSSQTVRITGGVGAYNSVRAVSCSAGGGVIQVHAEIKAGSGTQTMWGLWFDDPAGANLARWYGTGTSAAGRIGGTGIVTPAQTLTGGWDRLDVRINTATNESEFLFNGVSLGTLNHSITGAGDQVGGLWFERMDNSLATGNTVYFDNLRVGPADSAPPAPVTNFKAASGNMTVTLSWGNPTDADFVATKILYKVTGFPASPTDGAVLYNGSGNTYQQSPVINGKRCYYSAFTYDGFANYSSAAHAVTTPALEATIAEAKGLDDGQKRLLRGKVVSASFPGIFYVEEPAWVQGIKVLSSDAVAPGNLVDVVGALGGAGSERWLDTGGDNVIVIAPGPGLPPAHGMTNTLLGGIEFNAKTPGVKDGEGVNNIGLLVRVWGTVTATGDGFAYLDDGSSIADTRLDPATGQPYKGVRVYGLTSANAGEYWAAAGISTLDVVGPDRIRAVLATSTNKLCP